MAKNSSAPKDHTDRIKKGEMGKSFIVSEEFTETLKQHGAKGMDCLGAYIKPTANLLPKIDKLPVEMGFSCGLCSSDTSEEGVIYSTTEDTIKVHMRKKHGGVDNKSISKCLVQHLYHRQSVKVLFGVFDNDIGSARPISMTTSQTEDFEELIRSDPLGHHFNSSYLEQKTSSDERTLQRLYTELNWYELAKLFVKEEGPLAYKQLHLWVTLKTTDRNKLYQQLKTWTLGYFSHVRGYMLNPKYDTYMITLKVTETIK
jgi:hypothetical protein